jgi:hypothetical protein
LDLQIQTRLILSSKRFRIEVQTSLGKQTREALHLKDGWASVHPDDDRIENGIALGYTL